MLTPAPAPLQSGRVLKEHRIRYLSFLGIATNDRFCGYILDCGNRNGEKCFRFYGFRMEPNTDRLCLSLHTACQARFQRVLEANARRQAVRQQPSQVAGREVSSASEVCLMCVCVLSVSLESGQQVWFLRAGQAGEPEEVKEDICRRGQDLCGPVSGAPGGQQGGWAGHSQAGGAGEGSLAVKGGERKGLTPFCDGRS